MKAFFGAVFSVDLPVPCAMASAASVIAASEKMSGAFIMSVDLEVGWGTNVNIMERSKEVTVSILGTVSAPKNSLPEYLKGGLKS